MDGEACCPLSPKPSDLSDLSDGMSVGEGEKPCCATALAYLRREVVDPVLRRGPTTAAMHDAGCSYGESLKGWVHHPAGRPCQPAAQAIREAVTCRGCRICSAHQAKVAPPGYGGETMANVEERPSKGDRPLEKGGQISPAKVVSPPKTPTPPPPPPASKQEK